MPKKTYLCEQWPFLSVQHLQFQDGRFTTDNPADQAIIEGLDYYGVQVTLEEPERPPAPAKKAPARQGRTGTGQFASKEDEEDEDAQG